MLLGLLPWQSWDAPGSAGAAQLQGTHKAHGSRWRPGGAAEPNKPLVPGQKGSEEEVEEKKGEQCPRQASENRKHRGDSQESEFKAGKGKKMNKRAYGVSTL